jgi:hypothetical protein
VPEPEPASKPTPKPDLPPSNEQVQYKGNFLDLQAQRQNRDDAREIYKIIVAVR